MAKIGSDYDNREVSKADAIRLERMGFIYWCLGHQMYHLAHHHTNDDLDRELKKQSLELIDIGNNTNPPCAVVLHSLKDGISIVIEATGEELFVEYDLGILYVKHYPDQLEPPDAVLWQKEITP